MDTDFQIIVEFLARCGTEVEGHAVAAPKTKEAELLIRFATGTCTAEERAKACGLIQLHPLWLGWVSTRVKAMRIDPPAFSSNGATHSDS